MTTVAETARNTPAQQPLLSHLEAEDWLFERLKQHGADVYAGNDFPTLRERVRATITREKLGMVVIGRHGGKVETYAGCFERLYQQPLVEKPKRTSKATAK